MILIGSVAIKQYLSRNVGVDLDYLSSTENAFRLRQRIAPIFEKEYHYAFKDTNGRIVEIDYRPSTQQLLVIVDKIRLIDLCYTLKMSHRYLKNSPYFLKTMNDIHDLRSYGAVIPSELKSWFKLRERETYNYKHPSLMNSKTQFFGEDQNKYMFDHDSIHRAVKLYDEPAYEYYKGDDAEVFCDKTKFFGVSEEIRLAGGYEEAAVLSLERSLIPFEFKPDVNWAFEFALQKVCTSITSGFFREYCWEHYYEILAIHQRDPQRLIKCFIDGLNDDVIKLRHEEGGSVIKERNND